jgi:septum formation inhibitor-activating ATPase MinD
MAAPAGYDAVKWDTAVVTVLPHFASTRQADRWLNDVATGHRQNEQQGNPAARETLATWLAALSPLTTLPLAFDTYMRL